MNVQNSPAEKSSKRRFRPGCGWLVLLVLLPLLYCGLYFILRHPLPENPQLIAHRGGPAHAPENTLAAFRNAIAIGADWIEMDVQMTKDGELVVIHDETVDRTTNGSGAVRDLTLEEIRALDAGSGEQVPTFEEVISLAKEAGVKIMPEAKSPGLYPSLEAKMVEAIVEADYVEMTLVQSFEPQALETIKTLNPDIQVCPLYGIGQFALGGPQPGQANVVCPMAEMVVLYPWMLGQAHAKGYRAFVWFGVIENPLVMRVMLALGADGLMVDNPLALADILNHEPSAQMDE